MSKLLNFIRSDNGVALFTLFALSVMLFHTGFVFYIASGKGVLSGILAFLFALSIDSAILIFVLRARKNLSYIFSAFQVLMNIAHFYQITNTVDFISIAISLALPIIIAAYSHEIANSKQAKEITINELQDSLNRLNLQISEINPKLEQQTEASKNMYETLINLKSVTNKSSDLYKVSNQQFFELYGKP